jgi:curli biogenesis system outer membrane secretion channel CsgG
MIRKLSVAGVVTGCLVAALLTASASFAGTTSVTFKQMSSDPAPGGQVQVGGHVDGTKDCYDQRPMQIQRSRAKYGPYHTVDMSTTDSQGDYSKWITAAKHTRWYRSMTKAKPHCGKQGSPYIKIRVQQQ